MKTLLFFCLLISLSLTDSTQDCGDIPVQSAVYNLCAFSNTPPFNVSNPNFTGGLSFTLGTAHSPSCDGHESVWATYFSPQCIDLALEGPSYTQINESEPEQGIVLTFPEVEEIQQNYQLVVILTCDKDISDANDVQFQVTSSDTQGEVTTITVAGASRYGCPVISIGQLVNFLERNKQVFAIVFGLLGICLLLFGSKLFDAAIFIITTLIGTLLISTLIFELTDFGTQVWILWTIFGASLLVGLASGYLALKSVKFGFFVVGAALGVVAGLVLYNALILPFLKIGSGSIALYITIIVCGLVAGVVSVIISRSIIIVATSAIGAYLLVRAISVFIGGFPAETYVAQGTEQFSPVVYAYIVGMALLAAAGIYYQHKSSQAPKQTQDPLEVYYRYE